jgi:hypothetical protein
LDYPESKRFSFRSFGRKSLTYISKNSALSIWAGKETAAWNTNSLKNRLRSKTSLVGKRADGTVIHIDGRLTDVYKLRYPTLPVLAVVSQFNEVDIIEPVINHLLTQGIDVHVIDNWSNDGSYEAVEELSNQNPKRVSLERFPRRNSHKYEWKKILQRVTEVGKERPQYKWIISNDADEIRWSPWPGINLQKAISFIDDMGFNIVDYTVFNFSATKDGYRRGMDPAEFFEYGDFGHEGWHFMQLKTWQNNSDADIASSSGHLVNVPNPKIFPLKFLLAHYSLRSSEQAAKKVFQDRKPRFLSDERKRGWHSHYDKIDNKQSFIHDKKELLEFSKSNLFLEKFLIERVSGIGIKVNEISQE